jgi:acetyl esterase
MPLDPKAQEVLEAMRVTEIPETVTLSVTEARTQAIERSEARNSPLAEMHSIENRRVPGPAGDIPIRIYRPHCSDGASLIMFFHGGGWVHSNLDTHDAVSRALAHAARATVVSVDYRLAPEHKFPAASDDCLAATRWAGVHASELGADTSGIALAGDSAGGNLATVTAIRIRDEGGPHIGAQVLVYPITDYYDPGTPSYFEYAEGYNLTRRNMMWFWDHYIASRKAAEHPHASPLRSANVAGLPPALVITAEYDPLRDEGERYAAKLRDAGVDTTLITFDGMIHGFFSAIGVYRQSGEAVFAAAGWLRTKLGSHVSVVS